MKVRAPQHRPGEHLVVCDRCGFTVWSSEAKKTWDGLIVCPEDWEPRHPQDFVRGKDDKQSVTDPRPYPAPLYLDTSCEDYNGTARGATNITLTVVECAPKIWDVLNGRTLRLTSGPGSTQERVVAAYNGATKVATVNTRWSTNEFLWSNKFDESVWQTTNLTVAQDGDYYALTDSTGTAIGVIYQTVTVPDNNDPYVVSIKVKKTTGGTAPTVLLYAVLLVSGLQEVVVYLNSDTGQMLVATTARIIDGGDHWRVVMPITNDSSGSTLLRLYVYPAYAPYNSILGNVAVTGTCRVKEAQLEQAAVVSDYIGTTSTPAVLPDATTGYEVI